MKEKLEKIFSSSKLLVICGVLSAIMYVLAYMPLNPNEVSAFTKYDLLTGLFFAATIIGLLFSYRVNNTNVQKALVASLMFYFTVETINNFAYAGVALEYGIEGIVTDFVILGVALVLGIALFVSHLVLQSDHSGSNKTAIRVNQIVSGLYILLEIFEIFYISPFISNFSFLVNVAETMLILSFVIIETKIQLYRKTRAEAINNGTWNDETKAKAKEIFKI